MTSRGYEVVTPRAVAPLIAQLRGQRAGYAATYARLARDPCVLFVGKREPRHGTSDVWEVLHDLFGVENPPEGHHKPPCCEHAVPELPQDELDAFLRQLALLTRGRR